MNIFSILYYFICHPKCFIRHGLDAHNAKRDADIVRLRKEGMTLAAIGNKYGVSGERIRQILVERYGYTYKDSGRKKLVAAKKETDELKKTERLNAVTMAKLGITFSAWKKIRSIEGDPLRCYQRQRTNSYKRGIEWELRFNEWWEIWESSGKWAQHGRGKYVMSRMGDKGGYKVGNVHITTASENAKEAIRNHEQLGLGWGLNKRKLNTIGIIPATYDGISRQRAQQIGVE